MNLAADFGVTQINLGFGVCSQHNVLQPGHPSARGRSCDSGMHTHCAVLMDHPYAACADHAQARKRRQPNSSKGVSRPPPPLANAAMETEPCTVPMPGWTRVWEDLLPSAGVAGKPSESGLLEIGSGQSLTEIRGAVKDLFTVDENLRNFPAALLIDL